jgi:hypothetical protein
MVATQDASWWKVGPNAAAYEPDHANPSIVSVRQRGGLRGRAGMLEIVQR